MSQKLPQSKIGLTETELAHFEKILSDKKENYYMLTDSSFDEHDFAFHDYDSVELDSVTYKRLGMEKDFVLHIQAADESFLIDPRWSATFYFPPKVRVEISVLEKHPQPKEKILVDVVLSLIDHNYFLTTLINLITKEI